jgi:hypothetical protein
MLLCKLQIIKFFTDLCLLDSIDPHDVKQFSTDCKEVVVGDGSPGNNQRRNQTDNKHTITLVRLQKKRVCLYVFSPMLAFSCTPLLVQARGKQDNNSNDRQQTFCHGYNAVCFSLINVSRDVAFMPVLLKTKRTVTSTEVGSCSFTQRLTAVLLLL